MRRQRANRWSDERLYSLASSDEEKAARWWDYIKQHEGVTLKFDLGDGPVDGYVISRHGYEESKNTVADLDANPMLLLAYYEGHKGLIQSGSNYFGAWIENGRVFLDVSFREEDKQRAICYGHQEGQKAVTDMVLALANRVPECYIYMDENPCIL